LGRLNNKSTDERKKNHNNSLVQFIPHTNGLYLLITHTN